MVKHTQLITNLLLRQMTLLSTDKSNCREHSHGEVCKNQHLHDQCCAWEHAGFDMFTTHSTDKTDPADRKT